MSKWTEEVWAKVNLPDEADYDYDRLVNEALIDGFLSWAREKGLEAKELVSRRDDGDCYPVVYLLAAHKDGLVGVTYVDCICGGHGPRNARLIEGREVVEV